MLNTLRAFLQSEKFHYYVFGIILFNALVLGLQTIDNLEANYSTLLNYLELILVIFFYFRGPLSNHSQWEKVF